MSQNNLKQIAVALHDYHDDHHRLPSAVVRGKDGRPLYSWRVLVLPYLEENALYHKFRLDEPWDSPHNRPLLAQMPHVFTPPVEGVKAEPSATFYQVLVGTGTAFEGEEGLRLPRDFPDGMAQTFLVVEAGEAVPWTTPVDLAYAADRPVPGLGGLFNSPGRFSLFGPSRAVGFNAALADGSVRFLRADTSEATLRGLISRNGGEKLGDDW